MEIEEIRSEDEYRELYSIATRIRNQKLLTDSEEEAIQLYKKQVTDNEARILTKSWRSFFSKNILDQLKSQTDPLDPLIVCRLLKIISETESVPAYKLFGHHFSVVESMLCVLYNEPNTVAKLMEIIDNGDVSMNDNIVKVLFQLLYSCGLYPEDELRLAQAVCRILELQLSSSSSEEMLKVIHKETAISTRFYRLFIETSHPTLVYLTGALRGPIISVIQLGQFWLDIDEKQSANRFLRDNTQNRERLPEYRALVVSKLVELVDIFLEEIHRSLAILPPSLNWIIRNLFDSLKDGSDSSKLLHAIKDMFVSNLICSAIISPQKFGIIDNDVRIGAITSHNLVQIAMILKVIPLEKDGKAPSGYEEFMIQCRKTSLISEVMEMLLMDIPAPEVDVISLITNSKARSDRMSKTKFVGSTREYNTIMKVISLSSIKHDPSVAHIVKYFNQLPKVFTLSDQTSPVSSSKLQALKNIQKNMQLLGILKKSNMEESKELINNYLTKDNFEIFWCDYDSSLYEIEKEKGRFKNESPETRCLIDFKSNVDNINPVLDYENSDEPVVKLEQTQTNDTEERSIGNMVCETIESKSSSSIKNDTHGEVTMESKGLSKLRTIGDRMKKGLSQSHTLSDIRGHFLRSSSLIRHNETITSSSSEHMLSSMNFEGPRDDILEKYASQVGSRNRVETPILIDIDNGTQCNFSPYYSSENLLSCRAFNDTLRKLNTVLGSISYLPQINCRIHRYEEKPIDKKYLLYRFLGGLLFEAEHRREKGLAAQLLEVTRCVEIFKNEEVIILLDHLKNEEVKRETRFTQLKEERILLMRRANDISSLEKRIELSQMLYEQNLVDDLMRIFLNNGFSQKKSTVLRTPEVEAVLRFYDEFKRCYVQDERAELLNNLLGFLKSRLLNNQDWIHATDSMISRAMNSIERCVMFVIYDTAFHPNLEADENRDKVLRASVARVSQMVLPTSDFLKIPQRLHGEAPWPSAQAELSLLDIYVTACDKLKCIVRCCDVINNLIALSSRDAVASADDLIPVLVFVIMKANPRSLLSNVQFVETFAAELISNGKDAYYWTNFKSAVEYIKTIL